MADVPSPVLRDIRPFAGSNRLAVERASCNCLRVRLSHRRSSCLSLSYRHFFDAASSSLSSCAGTSLTSQARHGSLELECKPLGQKPGTVMLADNQSAARNKMSSCLGFQSPKQLLTLGTVHSPESPWRPVAEDLLQHHLGEARRTHRS